MTKSVIFSTTMDPPPLVMISYQWDAQIRMLKLKDELIKAGFDVWMDVDKMEGNLDDRMSEAVEKTSVVLACFSSNYQTSTSCKKEAQYADYLKKPIIPLKYEEYQPTGWLGLLINPLLYYDVQTDDTMMQELPKLIKAVEQKIAGHHEGITNAERYSCDLTNVGQPSRVSSRSNSFDVEVCQQELRTFYQQEMGTVQLLPWGDDVIDMDTIFVNLTLAVDEKQSSLRSSRQDIEKVEDMLALKGRTGQRSSRILLRGLAGSGKSTAMAKIAYDWATYMDSEGRVSNVLSQYKLVFILSLREIESHETLTDAIVDQILPQDTKISKQSLEAYIYSHGKETLILLDGLDEYPMERLQKKVTGDIECILANKKLRDACVVVSTRPQKVEDLGEHQKQYVHVKLSGFSEANVEVYIKKFFHDSQSRAKGLIKVLQQSPSIKVLAQIPVMLLMLCLLWSDAQKLPDTHTALYEQAVLYLWKRYKRSDDVTDKDDDFEEVLLQLGRVALDGLISDGKLVFLESDFPAQILDEACKAGLLTKERLRSKLNVSNSISFLHKSVQEYCAAFVWASLADTEVDLFNSYLKRIEDDSKVFAQVDVLTFCCGMNEKAATLILPYVMQVLKHRTEESLRIGGITQTAEKDIWPLLRMLRESRLKYEVVHSWFEPLFHSKVVEIRQNPPSSLTYFHHLVKMISKSTSRSILSEVHELKLFCGSGSFGLIVETLDEMAQVESLVLSWETEVVDTRPSESQILQLTERVKRLSNLKDIAVLARYKFDASGIIGSLYRGSKCSVSIRSIELGNVDFDPDIMGNALKKQTLLKSLLLTNISLTPQGAAQMISQIRSSLQTFQCVSTPVGEAIGHLKPLMPSLENIIVRDAKLQESDMQVLADLLPRAGRLRNLDISWNYVGSCMGTIARQLQHCPFIRRLIVMECNLTHSGVMALIERFQYMPRLETIMVSMRKISQIPQGNPGNGFEIMEAMFKTIHNLPKLVIMDFQSIPVPDGDPGSAFLNACMPAVNWDLPALVQRRAVEGPMTFSVSCRPRHGDRIGKLRAAIAQFEAQEDEDSGSAV